MTSTKSLLFLPDISGFTKFIQSTEVAHSQHVIAELLEVLIKANTLDLKLAEVEGDALFFYKESDIPSQEKLLAQIESMFTAFYKHLKLLETNRICPCNACATAPELQLKIVAHCGELQFMAIQGNRKPFGQEVIEAHRLMKNSVESDNYTLLSKELANEIGMPDDYRSKIFNFHNGSDRHDGKEIPYVYSIINKELLKIDTIDESNKMTFDYAPQLTFEKDYPISAAEFLEYVSNFRYRKHWVEGVDDFEFNENENTRVGTEHVCVIDKKRLDFTTVIKKVEAGQLIYGERTSSPPPVDELYRFFIITPIDNKSCKVNLEVYWTAKSLLKKLMMAMMGKKTFIKINESSLNGLYNFVTK